MTVREFFDKFGVQLPGGVSALLGRLAEYCEEQAVKDSNLVVQEYHDQWMAARTELLRCAETIRKGGE